MNGKWSGRHSQTQLTITTDLVTFSCCNINITRNNSRGPATPKCHRFLLIMLSVNSNRITASTVALVNKK